MKKLYYDVNRCLGCKNCEIFCAVSHSKTQDLFSMLVEAYPTGAIIWEEEGSVIGL